MGLGIYQGIFFLGGGAGPAIVGAFLAAHRAGGAQALNPLYTLDAAPFSDAFLLLSLALLLAFVAFFGLSRGTRERIDGKPKEAPAKRAAQTASPRAEK